MEARQVRKGKEGNWLPTGALQAGRVLEGPGEERARGPAAKVGLRGVVGEAIQMRWTVQGNAWSPAQGVWESGGLVSGHRGARPWKGQTRSRKETGSRPASQWHWELGKGSPRETELEAFIGRSHRLISGMD